VAGYGPPVLLVHAGICDARMWDRQWDTFARAHRVIRCDLRGFGEMPMPSAPFSNARDLADLIEALDAGPVAAVGVSMGALAVLDLTLGRPDLVSALVVVGATLPDHDWSAEVAEFDAAELAAFEAGDLDAAVELNLRMWVDGPRRGPGEVDPDVRAKVAEMQRRAFELQLDAGEDVVDERLVPDLGERLGEIAVPTLVAVGELDCDDMLAIAARLAVEIPGARHERLPGVAHVPSMERPAEFDELVLGFLAS
jgi:pimeloyl-ACP methyl ester carboxylesterase